eukprot:CAMPEP_0196825230 /NCGR_PEP_ID=MMETSP1362-20130617/92928_1 /TAXON_ID=163516 /ORGANISM="Leptocylindrus danicus, Strain CCMP1856" /LENGTH=87 /DNA_ID=CAMNT_0042205613 /DNA_START=635 /DNA_END=898 /DNA_ORIENTATION=-
MAPTNPTTSLQSDNRKRVPSDEDISAKQVKRKAVNKAYYESHHDEVNERKRNAYIATADARNAVRRAKYSTNTDATNAARRAKANSF